ncbi:MAG: methyltransferase domain-containing protein [Candidatus Zixiibacteriota bacterium]|jgi:ubiquinone/menaquinone biosynthesis C-methylase UbiE
MSHDAHQKFYDELAQEWDLMFTSEDLERLHNLVERFNVKPGMDIVDVGCGTGILFDILRREVGEKGTVTGVDFSIQMARQAHRNFPFPNVNVVDADVTALPFRDNSFDMAVSFSAFPHFSDKAKALSEIFRVLKPGAKLHIIHLQSSKELSEIHHQIGGVVERDELPSEDAMRSMLRGSGFSEVVVDDHPGLYLATATANK